MLSTTAPTPLLREASEIAVINLSWRAAMRANAHAVLEISSSPNSHLRKGA